VDTLLSATATFFETDPVRRYQGTTWTIMREEIFGPVLAVTRYEDRDELSTLIERANKTEYGSRGVCVDQGYPDCAQDFRTESGPALCFVNMPPIPDMAAPWGGYKASGWGREMGAVGH